MSHLSFSYCFLDMYIIGAQARKWQETSYQPFISPNLANTITASASIHKIGKEKIIH